MALATPSIPVPLDQEAGGFCDAVLGVAERATRAAPREHAFRLCDRPVRLRVAGDELEGRLTRALRHAGLAPDAGPPPALRVFALDARATGGEPPPRWPFRHRDRRHLERLHVTRDGRCYLTLDEDTGTWQVFDRTQGRAAIWTRDAAALPEWERAFPLRTLLNWLLAPAAETLAHAAVVCEGDRGLLLAGAGGSGKSTTTAACLAAGLATCGDDFVAVSLGARPRAHALFDTLKLDERSLRLFPRFAGAIPARPPPGAKARIHLSELDPSPLRPSCALEAIVVPRLAPGEPTRIAPLPKQEALRALAPTTIFLTRGAERETAAKLAALVRGLPTFGLRIGGAPGEAASTLRGFLERGVA
jgi:hypothetical protein